MSEKYRDGGQCSCGHIKKMSNFGCTSCWHCPHCGAIGCDNNYDLYPNNSNIMTEPDITIEPCYPSSITIEPSLATFSPPTFSKGGQNPNNTSSKRPPAPKGSRKKREKFVYFVERLNGGIWYEMPFTECSSKLYCEGYVDALDGLYPSDPLRIVKKSEDGSTKIVRETRGHGKIHLN